MQRWIWFLGFFPSGLALACGAPPAARSAGEPQPPAPAAPPAASVSPAPAADPAAAALERGRYLVSHVAACGDCHTPKTADRHQDPARTLAGVDCFIDALPADPARGCLSTANLTNHETGLRNRTDGQIKDLFLRGVRPDGKALHPMMPYRYFANMSDADADAIVSYLRSVPGVEHTVTPNQAPFLAPAAPAARVPESLIPLPRADYPERTAALRGRYLAGNVGSCLACHTPRGKDGPLLEKAFQGGLEFRRESLGLPANFPDIIYSANLTPAATGIAGYAVADIVRALHDGEDPNQRGSRLCAPMPAGPLGTFGGLTPGDATDIAHYLLSLPPAEHAIPSDCRGPALEAERKRGERRDRVQRLAAFARTPEDPSLGTLWLSALGLYGDSASQRIAAGLRAFEPAYPLYSDGAKKRRWLALPADTRIDSSDPAHWSFPTGTLLFKEFALGEKRIETRVLARTGPGADDFFMGAFVWNAAGTDARFEPGGAAIARDSVPYEVPSARSCWSCHGGDASRVLGFSAVQQPHVPNDLLSVPPSRPFVPPGDDATRAALGYLHGNCGHCHNPRGSARPDTDLELALRPSDSLVTETGAYRTAVARPLTSFQSGTHSLRVAPGDGDASALLFRMSETNPDRRMPPLGTRRVDAAGVALVRRWIEGL